MKLESSSEQAAAAERAPDAAGLRAQQIDINGAIQDAKAAGADPALPPVEFIISRGQKETVYFKDGSSQERLSEQKIDPNCKNSVKTPDGSQQGFDGVGLCKLRGNVRWGKSTPDGVMEIAIGEKTKIQLDSRWQLLSVKSENANYDKAAHEAKIAKEQSILEHKPTLVYNESWKPLYPEATAKAAKKTPDNPARKAGAKEADPWRATVKKEVAEAPPRAKPGNWEAKISKRQDAVPPLDIRPSQHR